MVRLFQARLTPVIYAFRISCHTTSTAYMYIVRVAKHARQRGPVGKTNVLKSLFFFLEKNTCGIIFKTVVLSI